MKTTKKTEVKNPDQKSAFIESEPEAAYNWFPGHMLKATREIKERVSHVDIVIEIRDARVPLVSGNASLTEMIKGKARLIVLNKANLADPQMMKEWSTWFKKEGIPHLFVNCLEKSAVKNVLTSAKNIIKEKKLAKKNKYRFMVIGLPNTGKSTFINQLSNRHAAKTANKPGHTQVQAWVIVDDTLELLDTPGIMPPEIKSIEHRYWLSAINAIPDEIIGVEEPATYLVNYFLENQSEAFKTRYQLESFDLSLDETLLKIATVRGCLQQKGVPDLDRVYKLILIDFRTGELGKVCFGRPSDN